MERIFNQPSDACCCNSSVTCNKFVIVSNTGRKNLRGLLSSAALSFFVLCLALGYSLDSKAQNCGIGVFSGISEAPPGCNVTTTRSVGSGTFTWLYLTAGAQYEVSTCGSSFDTQLSVYKYNGGANTFYTGSDDNGPWCSGINASLTIQPAATDWYAMRVSRYYCQGHDFTGVSAVLKYRQIPPTLSVIAGDQNNCSGETTTIRASQPNGSWSVVAGPSGAGLSVLNSTDVLYTAPNANGTNTIRYTLGNCFVDINVNTYLYPSVSLSGATNICAGTTTVFTASASVSGYTISTYEFLRNSAVVQSGPINTYTTGIAGAYNVRVYSSGNNCSVVSNQITLNVNANPTSGPITCSNCISGNIFCYGSTATLNANATAGCGTIATYQWYLNGNPIAGGGAQYIASTPGNYTVKVTNSCAPGTCSTTSATFTLIQNPQIIVNAGSDVTLCPVPPGNSITLGGSPTASGGTPGYSYAWSPAGGTVSNPSFTNLTTTSNYTVTVTDSRGCTASDVVLVTVGDVTLPNISCPGNLSRNTDLDVCYSSTVTSNPIFSDNCSATTLTWAITGATTISSGGTGINYVGTQNFNKGTNTVTYTVTDQSGNTRTCAFTVTVTDNQPPVVTCPANITRNNDLNVCGAVVTYGGSASDNCPGLTGAVISGLVSGSTFPKGTTTNVFQVTDAAGLTATCSFTVTVVDNQLPSITCPANITQSTDVGVCSAIVNYTISSSDNCPGVANTLVSGLVSGSSFNQGTTTVTWKATDAAGLTKTCSFTVTIVDLVPPTISCPANITTYNSIGSCGAVVSYVSPSASDNCGSVLVDQIGGLASGSFFAVGTTTNIFRATDNDGNTATCSFTVTVIDNKPPIALCKNITVDLSSGGTVSITASQVDNVSSDECGVSSLAVNTSSFGCSNVGNNMVVLTVTDVNGNTASCTSTVTVRDVTPPVAVCQNFTVSLSSTYPGSATITTANIDNGSSDACGVTLSLSKTSFNCADAFAVSGLQGVVLTATDPSGNTATCSATVRVNDVTNPTALCKNITIQLNTAGTQTIANDATDNGSYDNCSVAYSLSKTSYNCTNVGNNNVTLTVTDPTGNTAVCNSVVTVEDVTPPTAVCKNITVDLNSLGTATTAHNAIDNGSSDACGIATRISSKISWDCSNVGNNTVTLTLTDVNGNTSTCTGVVTVRDVTLPNAICQNITIQLDASGNASITAAQVDNGSNDACGVASLAVFPSAFTCADEGPDGINQVVLTVTDVNGNQNTCMADVDVQDLVPPVALCQNFTIELDFAGNATIYPADFDNGSNDACGISSLGLTATLSTGSFTNASAVFVGCDDVATSPNPVVLVVTDVNGNTTTCNATVTVLDNVPPTLECYDVTKNNDPGVCQAYVSVPVVDVNDNCVLQGVTITNDGNGNDGNDASGVYPVGVTTVTWTVTDAFNNTETCSFTVTVIDNEAPTAMDPPNQFFLTNPGLCYASAIIQPLLNVNDNCGVASVVNSYTGTNNASGNYPDGITAVVWTITDIHGNVTNKFQFIAVIDLETPQLVAGTCPGPITVGTDAGVCKADVSIPVPQYTDNCGVGFILLKNNLNQVINSAPATFTLGSHTVTWVALDIHSNQNVSCAVNVTVVDDDAPAITCPANQNKNTDVNVCNAVVSIPVPTFSDNCSVASVVNDRTGTNNASGTYPVGTTNVVYTVTDGSGNTATCSFTVTVTDNQLPAITCPSNVSTTTDLGACNAVVNISVPVTSDNCGISGVLNNYNGTGDASDTYSVGSTTVVWVVTDVNGNTKQCTHTVTVTDTEVPVILCPGDVLQSVDGGSCGANVLIATPSTSDNCGVASFVNDYNGGSDASGYYAVGITVVTWTVTDVHGLTAICSHQITIVDDEVPYITCAADQTHSTDAGECSANVTVIGPTYGDNCGVANLTNDYTGSGDASSIYAVGTTTITWTVTDIYGNINLCSQNITVIDNEAPSITCAPDQTQTADPGECQAVVMVVSPATGDNCGVGLVTNDRTGTEIADDIYPVGTVTLTWTVTDIYGNVSQCTQTITVTDNEAPYFVCSSDQTHTADAGVCEATITVSSPLAEGDNCGVDVIINNINGTNDASGTYPVGTTTITWTISDIYGNTSTCQQTITVTDDEAPTITCASDQSQNTDLGVCEAAVSVVAPTTGDNCAVASVVNDYNGTSDASDIYPIGTSTITWTVTDIHGHTASCTQTITISDNENPSINCAANQTQTADAGECEAGVVVTGPATGDNCGVATVVNDRNGTSDASGDYPVGTTTLTWTVTDIYGNSSQCTQDITVTDDENPTITCPVDVFQNTDPGVCVAAVTIAVPSTSDNCGVASVVNTKTGTDNASSTYVLGITPVTYTVTDIHGNSTTCSFSVTIDDNELPTIVCPSNKVINNTTDQCDGTVIIAVPATGDNCGVASVVNDYNGSNNASGTYPVGVTTVTYTVTDVNGNSTTCSFTVTVNDIQKPVFGCPTSVTQTADPGACEAYVTIPVPIPSDNCGVDTILNDYNLKADGSDIYPVGTTTLLWTAIDMHGNTSTCNQSITITDDENPTITCAPDQAQSNDLGVCGAFVSVVPPATGDNCGVASVVNDYNGTSDASDFYPVGVTTIEWTVEDIYGHEVSCQQTIVVTDDEYPTITCPDDIVQTADPTLCQAAVFIPAPVVGDNCGVDSVKNNYTWTNNASGVYPVGTTTVLFGVSDIFDQWTLCTFTVTITDDEQPTVVCPSNIVVTNDGGECEAGVTIAVPYTSDNCGVASVENDYTGTNNASGNYLVGTTSVQYTVTDIHGNSTTCSFTVTVNDNEDPTVTCPADVVQTADAGVCEASVNIAVPANGDNCSVASVVNDYNGTSDASDIYAVGTETVTYTVTDIYGNTAECSFIVTITDDEVPSITCPADITQTADAGECEAGVTIALPIVDDNCGIDMIVYVLNGDTANIAIGDASGDYPVGTTVVTYGVGDIHDNWSQCDFTVTITDDENPTITCPANQVHATDPGVCTSAFVIAIPATDDNCAVATIENDYNSTSNASDTYPLGTTTVTFTVTDIHGNSTTCNFTVTVNDQEVPTITCPADIIQTADPGLCTAVVTVPVPPAYADNCAIATVLNSYNGTANASDVYPVGVTIVEWTATDPSGNSSDCAMSILVTDNENPTITCPANITQTADAGQCNADVTVPLPVTGDNCSVAGWTNGYNGTADASDNYPVGTTSIVFTVLDGSGNFSTCSFSITITDNEAPQITCVNQTQFNDLGVCEAYVTVPAQPTWDNCGVAGIINDRYNSNNGSGIYPVGTTSVIWTVTDIHGNTSSCTQTITVIDNEAPVTVCQDITIQLDAGTNNGDGSASITTGDIDNGSTDNCGIASYSLDETDFDCSEVGANTVILTVTDIYGNTNTCSATVTVEDNIAPIAVCQNVTIQLDEGTSPVGGGGDGAASITTGDIDNGSSDNCGVASFALDETDFDCSEVGVNTVVLTVTDVNGNTTTCTATVTVEDNVAPDARCQNVTIQLDAGTSPAGTTGGGAASITTGDIDNNSTDNCTIASLVLDETDFDCSEVGENTVVLTVTDVNGNVSTCSATVTVEDNVAPDARCHDITINLPRTGPVGIVPGDIDSNSTDNCGIASLSVAPDTFLCSDKGDNIVVLTVTDVNGNVSTCSATVTVTTDPLVITELSSPTFNCGYNISCNGNSDGSIALEVIGGCLPYTYAWSNGATTEDQTGLPAGTYYVTITDANGDFITDSITLTEPDLLVASGVKSVYECGYNISCHGYNDGSIDVTVVGGCEPYTYVWTTPNGSGLTAGAQDQSGLTRGIYRVLITDDNGCSQLLIFQLTEPDSLVITNLSSAVDSNGFNVSCFGASDGSIDLEVDGGADCLPYTYQWAGPDTVYITVDTVANNVTLSGYVIASRSGSSSSSSSSSGSNSGHYCGGGGSGGGASNCNISYREEVEGAPDNSGATWYSIGDKCVFELIHELPAGASYTIRWRQKPGQSGTSSMKVYESADGVIYGPNAGSPLNTTNEAYFDQTIIASAPTRYVWLEAAASPDFEVDAITYSFVTTTYEIIVDTTTGGAFTATTEDLTGLWAGEYCVTITDANGCSVDSCITLTGPDPLDVGICDDQTVVFGYYPENVALITTNVTGGVPPYNYYWSTGETTPSIEVAPTITTTYTVTVTSQNGCIGFASHTVTVVDIRCGSGLDRVSMCNTSNKNYCVKQSDVPGKLALGWTLGDCGGNNVLCSNGIDDDHDGLIDCDDPNCFGSVACGGVYPIDLSNGNCGAPVIEGCACEGGIKSYTVQYNGASGVTINAYANSGHSGLLATFINVHNGDQLTVNAAGSGVLNTYTYFEIVGSSPDVPVFTGCGSITVSGNASAVYSSTGVPDATDATGSVNSSGADLYESGDNIVLTLGHTIPAGTTYKLYWRQRPGQSGVSTLAVSESSDGLSFTANSASPLSTYNEYYFYKSLTAAAATKYVKVEATSSNDLNVDAVTYSFNVSQGVGLVSGPFTTISFVDRFNSTCNDDVPSSSCNICEPDGYIKLMAVKYYGTSGALIKVRNYPSQNVFQMFYNVQNGDELIVNGTFNNGNALDDITYLEVVSSPSSPYVSIPTECSNGRGEALIGRTFGDFKVTGVTDNRNNACGMTPPCPCSGGISFLGLIYNGPAGGTVKAYAKSGHQDLLQTYSNLQPGDSILVRSDVLNMTKFNSTTYFELVGYIPDIAVNTSCSDYILGMEFGPLTVYGYVDKNGVLCNMTPPPACPCDGGISSLTIDYDVFDSLSVGDATVNFYADQLHTILIASFTDVDPGEVIVVSAAGLPGGIFDTITFVQILGSGRPDIKLPTSCENALDELIGASYRELFIQKYTDAQGHGCDNDCGVGKTLMCHAASSSSSWSYSHGTWHNSGGTREQCVKNKDVNKKLQTGDWTLGPCQNNAKPEQLVVTGGEGFELTAQPNPFSETTTISFRMAEEERVSLVVYNVAGEEVAKLFEGLAEKNQLYQLEFKAELNPDGMYFYRLVTESGDVYIRKLVQSKQ